MRTQVSSKCKSGPVLKAASTSQIAGLGSETDAFCK